MDAVLLALEHCVKMAMMLRRLTSSVLRSENVNGLSYWAKISSWIVMMVLSSQSKIQFQTRFPPGLSLSPCGGSAE